LIFHIADPSKPLEVIVETWHVDGATITGVPFYDLKEIGKKNTEI